MPGMTGIDFINQAYQIDANIDFIIISGYSEFQYAQNAIKLGVEDYLLKPIQRDEINQCLKNLIQKRNIIKDASIKNTLVEKELQDKNNTIRKNSLTSFILTGQSECLQLCNEKGEKIFRFSDAKFCVFALQISYYNLSLTGSEHSEMLLKELPEAIYAILPDDCTETEYVSIGLRTYYVLNYPDIQNIKSKVINILTEWLRVKQFSSPDYDITISAGLEADSIDGLYESYDTAKIALSYRLGSMKKKVIDYDDLIKYNLLNDVVINEQQLKSMKAAVITVDIDKCCEIVGKIVDEFIRARERNIEKMYILSEKILDEVYSCFPDDTADMKSFITTKEDYQSCLNNYGNLLAIKDKLLLYIRQIMERYQVIYEKDDIQPIREAKKYIKIHLERQIGLEEIAEILGLNSTYFSKLFKKHVGMTFSNYMIKERIEEGKKLLRTTNEPINSIAGKVGYADTKHFSRLFIKNVGVKPVEYREFYK